MNRTDIHQNHRGLSIWPPLFLLFLLLILASLFFAGSTHLGHGRQKTSAIAAMSSLVQACEDYYEDNQHLPLHEGMTSDYERHSNNDLMQVLSYDGVLPEESPFRVDYFDYKTASGKPGDRFDGLDMSQNQIRLLGPWKNKAFHNRYYRLIMDYDFNEQIQEPHALGGKVISGERVLIYHLGKDGQAGPGMNKDNVYSYK